MYSRFALPQLNTSRPVKKSVAILVDHPKDRDLRIIGHPKLLLFPINSDISAL